MLSLFCVLSIRAVTVQLVRGVPKGLLYAGEPASLDFYVIFL